MTSSLNTQHWHNEDGVRLSITCDDRSCLAEVLVPSAAATAIDLEILQRGKDKHGQAIGPAVSILQQTIKLRSGSNSKHRVGRLWLPKSVCRRVHECFYRVRFPVVA